MTGPFSQVSAEAARGAIETARRFVECAAGSFPWMAARDDVTGEAWPCTAAFFGDAVDLHLSPPDAKTSA